MGISPKTTTVLLSVVLLMLIVGTEASGANITESLQTKLVNSLDDASKRVLLESALVQHQMKCQFERLLKLNYNNEQSEVKVVKIPIDCVTGPQDKTQCCRDEGMSELCLPLCNGIEGAETGSLDVYSLEHCAISNMTIMETCLIDTPLVHKRFEDMTRRCLALARHNLALAQEDMGFEFPCAYQKGACTRGCLGCVSRLVWRHAV